MRRQLLVSTATAALLSGLVFATAQEMPRAGGKQEGMTQKQGAPSGAQRGESRQGMPQGQDNPPAEQRGAGKSDQGKGKQAQPKSDRSQEQATGQNDRGQSQREQGKANQAQPKPDRNRQQQTTGQGQREQRDQGKAKQQAQPKPDQNRQQQQTTGQGQREQRDPGKAKQQAQPDRGTDQTVGQGRQQQDRTQGRQDGGERTAAQGNTQLSVEQRTRIRETVFARSDVPRVDNVNIRISVGTSVPARVRVAPLPREIVEIRPQFRNHQFFVVRDEIVILDNRRRIVEVIPVESASGPAIRGGGGRTDVVVDLSPDEIREVQRVLIQRGFSVEVDGRLGPRTRQALIQFQRREGLQTTGRIDSRTISSLGVTVRSNHGGGGQQPSTSGQGGPNQGSGAAQQPSSPSQGANQGANQGGGEPQRSPQGGQSGKQSGAGTQGGQDQPSPTTGQGSGRNGNQPANQGSGAEQGGASNPAAKQMPSSGGTTGNAGGARPGDQPQPK